MRRPWRSPAPTDRFPAPDSPLRGPARRGGPPRRRARGVRRLWLRAPPDQNEGHASTGGQKRAQEKLKRLGIETIPSLLLFALEMLEEKRRLFQFSFGFGNPHYSPPFSE